MTHLDVEFFAVGFCCVIGSFRVAAGGNWRLAPGERSTFGDFRWDCCNLILEKRAGFGPSVFLEVSNDNQEQDFPLNFYFNGEVMPKWGACWGMAGVPNYLWTGGDPDQNIIHQEILYAIYCKIDHAGVVEGANPDVFIFAVHEILHLFLSRRDGILATLCRQSYGQPQEVYSELIEAALQMQRLALECRCAYWTSGNEGDRALLFGAMRRCQLPPGAKEFEELAPELRQYRKEQVGRLHQLALSDRFDEKLRKRLSAIRAV